MDYDNSAGYTLIESLVVLAIVGAVVISVPAMLQWVRQQGIHHAVDQIRADLQSAKMMAIRQKQICRLQFNSPTGNRYINTITGRQTDLQAFRGGVHFLDHGPDGRKMASEASFNSRGMSCSVIPTNILIGDELGLETYCIRILLPGGVSVYRWDGGAWK